MMSGGSTTDDACWLLCRREELRVDQPPLLNVPVRDTDNRFGLLSLPLSAASTDASGCMKTLVLEMTFNVLVSARRSTPFT